MVWMVGKFPGTFARYSSFVACIPSDAPSPWPARRVAPAVFTNPSHRGRRALTASVQLSASRVVWAHPNGGAQPGRTHAREPWSGIVHSCTIGSVVITFTSGCSHEAFDQTSRLDRRHRGGTVPCRCGSGAPGGARRERRSPRPGSHGSHRPP